MQFNQAQKYALIFIAGVIFFLGCWYLYNFIPRPTEAVISPVISTPNPTPRTPSLSPTPGTAPSPKLITFYICGAVRTPGVYSLPEGSRAADAIKAAGGTLPNADIEAINLAHKIHDEEKIVILAQQDKTAGTAHLNTPRERKFKRREWRSQPRYKIEEEFSELEEEVPESNKININSATASDLEKLPGIGVKTAQKIIEYRSSKGGFTTLEELLEIPGIGPAKFEKIKPYLEL
jgi:competence protein ComEA